MAFKTETIQMQLTMEIISQYSKYYLLWVSVEQWFRRRDASLMIQNGEI